MGGSNFAGEATKLENSSDPNTHMGVSKNNGTPKSSILIGFSIIFTTHFGVPRIFGNTHITSRSLKFFGELTAPGPDPNEDQKMMGIPRVGPPKSPKIGSKGGSFPNFHTSR